MGWLLFTYWLPAEPSRKRVFVWRQLKKLGALSMEGAGWILPGAEPFPTKIMDIVRTVEEMGGTSNLYKVTDFSEAQEQRTVTRFNQEREKEYAELIKECHKMMRHMERERQQQEFDFEEVQELESDLGKIVRWFSEAKERDAWDIGARNEVDETDYRSRSGTVRLHAGNLRQNPGFRAEVGESWRFPKHEGEQTRKNINYHLLFSCASWADWLSSAQRWPKTRRYLCSSAPWECRYPPWALLRRPQQS